MKKLVLLIALMIPYAANSQDLSDLNLYVSGGLSVPASSNDFSKNFDSTLSKLFFSDYWKSGFNINAGLAYPLSSKISIMLEVNYSSFAFDVAQVKKGFYGGRNIHVEDGELTTISINGSVKYSFPVFQKIGTPYLIGSAGLMSINSDKFYALLDAYSNVSYSFSKSNVLTSAFGGGIDIPGGDKSGIFIDVRVVVGFTESKVGMYYYVPIRCGFKTTL